MSRRQPFSSFGATSLEDEASVFGRHAGAEAMRLGASSVVRLKGALRHRNEFSSKTKTLRLAVPCVYVKERTTAFLFNNIVYQNAPFREAIIGCCFIRLHSLINPKLLC